MVNTNDQWITACLISSVPSNISDTKGEDSDNEDNSEEDTPVVQNAFAILNVDDD